MKTRSQIRALDDSTLEVLVYDAIGAGLFGPGVTARSIVEALASKPRAKTIQVRVNSPGGDVFEGLAIYNALKASPARIVVTVEGLAASAASFVAMAGDEVRMAQGAMLMIHEARTYVDGGSVEDLERERDVLAKINATLVDIYVARSKGKTREDVVAAMAAETYLTAAEAVEWGLADSIAEDVEASPEVVALAQARPRGRELITRFAAMTARHSSEKNMSLKIVAKKLKLKAEATEEEVVEQIDEIVEDLDEKDQRIKELEALVAELQQQLAELLAASGEDAPAEAVAAVRAGQSARRAHAQMEARVAELERAAEAVERGTIVAKLRAERKVTPAMEREFVAAMSLDALRAFARVAPRVVAETLTQPLAEVGMSSLKTPSGKTWGDLRPVERARLKAADPDLYAAMRSAAGH